ncbi:ABC1 kinase family protein [Antarcticirhabdus aurantiaca]|uniref:AarF/ABC1/UbiB kinase family protein n=1 Tax=Antarcticirhabdus aurantiaca TaxID=2606717 RepID=A0ACD4NM45_9HYPH|nr:AarF/ABC1/UbiB kinase family protein [Antarcticirhabdus aurantiaca]WAJ27985.1 AarF/ABC1/UbiB kinase family protein [Jeongeuplla avenae]
MPNDSRFDRGRPVPSGRLSRLAAIGGLAGSVAGNVLRDGAGRLARGERPRLSDLVLTPRNVTKATDQLARMRGAAMKLGQLLSMDAGELLPPELSEIMARLRADAEPMPRAQLEQVLSRELGADWRSRFEYVSHRPIAAASIGQVHRALTTDGRDVAIKVQYPGIARSIDSDVDNVAAVLRMSGLIPRHLDVSPLLDAAKAQLREEADYGREAEHLTRFGELVAGDERFVVPSLQADLSTRHVLAMSFVDSDPIETAVQMSQGERDRIAAALIDLSLRELFDFRLVQTDPNPANYRIEKETGRIALLDFGATRSFDEALVSRCRDLLRAAKTADRALASEAIVALGLSGPSVPPERHARILDLFAIASAFLRREGPADFANDAALVELRDEALRLSEDRNVYLVPPADPLFLQRKYAGLYLLALRLRARVDLASLLDRHLAAA